jgi:hypothetical protein
MIPTFGCSCILEIPVADDCALNWGAGLDEGCYCGPDLNPNAGALHREDRLARSTVGCILAYSAVTVQIIDVDGN